jgi:hypothetical protein
VGYDIVPINNSGPVMLGKNDVHRELYNTDSPSIEVMDQNGNSVTDTGRVWKNCPRLKDADVDNFLLTPSPYDQTANIEVKTTSG